MRSDTFEARAEAKPILRVSILLISFVALGLRFIHLEADFPPGINWSGDLYTDEGWYSNNAIARQLTGEWTIEGDFNPIVTLPVFNVTQAAAFSVLGLSLTTARITEVVFSILVCVFAYLLVARLAGPLPGLVTLLLLSTNFTLFAFSRLAILDLPMTAFTLMSFLLATSRRWTWTVNVSMASFVFCLAALTKTTALFGLPALLYLIWTSQPSLRKGRLALSASLIGIALLLGVYYVTVSVLYSEAVAGFVSTEFAPRLEWTLPAVVNALARAVWNGMVLDRIVYPLTLLSLPLFLVGSQRAKKNRLAVAFSIWLLISFVALGVRGYLPPRYYLPLIVPVVSLFGMMSIDAFQKLRPSRWSHAPALLVVGVAAVHLFNIARYLGSPEFTFVEMAGDVEERIDSDKDDNLLIGNMANSITLATGIPSINSVLGTRDLRWKALTYRPTHYIALGEEKETARQLSEVYYLEELSAYDVFGNYYDGKRVRLYKLVMKP